jgi:hypothetical protein
MLVIQRDDNLYKEINKKLNRSKEYINLPKIELIKRSHIYILAEDHPIAKAFLYSCYLLAKRRGLRIDLYKLERIDIENFESRVKYRGERWVEGGLTYWDLAMLGLNPEKYLKNLSINEISSREANNSNRIHASKQRNTGIRG